MEPDSPFNLPVGSFRYPVPLPDVEPDASPVETLQINSTWLQYLRGAAKQLLLETTWDTKDPDALNLVQQRVMNLIDLLQGVSIVSSELPVGSIVMFGAIIEADLWLPCDGQPISRTDYAELFAAIGTTWGPGDGTTTFNLPDLRGRVPMDDGQGGGLTSRLDGQVGGEETHVLSSGEMPSHVHQETATPGPGSGSVNVYYVGTTGFTQYYEITSASRAHGSGVVNPQNTQATGSDQAHNNLQPYAVVSFQIKVLSSVP